MNKPSTTAIFWATWILSIAILGFYALNAPLLLESVGHLGQRASIAGMSLPFSCRLMLQLGDPMIGLIGGALAGLPIIILVFCRGQKWLIWKVAAGIALFCLYFGIVRWSMTFPERETLRRTGFSLETLIKPSGESK